MKNKLLDKKTNYARTCLFAMLLSVFISLSPLHKTNAALWPAIDPIIKQNLEEISYHIKGIILGTLKQAAAKMLNEQIGKLVGGTSTSSAKFITDWRKFMIKDPEDRTNVYINDRLSKMTSGKGSSTGYISTQTEGFSGNGNYNSQLVTMAKKLTTEKEEPKVTYSGNPSEMFAKGTFQDMSSYLSGINNPWAFDINAQREYQEKLEEEKKIQETKAQSYFGFKGSEKKDANGNVMITNPGSLTALNVANVQDLGNKIIAAATHPEEVITAVVTQMITKAIEEGIGEVESIINREVDKVQTKITNETNKLIETSGPGARYGN